MRVVLRDFGIKEDLSLSDDTMTTADSDYSRADNEPYCVSVRDDCPGPGFWCCQAAVYCRRACQCYSFEDLSH